MEQTVLVTGGTGGLGTAVTRAFLDVDWRVVVPWIVEPELERLPDDPRLTLVQADLFLEDAVRRCVDTAAADEDAPLRAVVNLVGGFDMGPRVHETPVDRFEDQLRINLRATYLTCHAALPVLLDGGGSIVCMSSRAALRPFSGGAGYITAKAAVLGLVDALAVEYADEHIRVNALLPGVIDTPANREAMPDSDRAGWVAPEVIAKTVLFLCSPESAATTGAHLPVDHG